MVTAVRVWLASEDPAGQRVSAGLQLPGSGIPPLGSSLPKRNRLETARTGRPQLYDCLPLTGHNGAVFKISPISLGAARRM